MSLVELFCHVDDFCQAFEPLWIRDQFRTGRRRRAGPLCLSEIMTLLIWFHTSQYRTFKAFYRFRGASAMDVLSSSCLRRLFRWVLICVHVKAPARGFVY